jgi:dCTP deaminase
MILTGPTIRREVQSGRINISPFRLEHVTSNSYDLTLGPGFVRYTEEIIDPAKPNRYHTFHAGPEGIRLGQGDFLLGHSAEVLGSDHYVPIIHARSSVARLGLFVHVTADLIDIGSHGNVTFQLFSTLLIIFIPGMRRGQVSFWKPLGKVELYRGKYQGSRGPRPSEVYKDFWSDTDKR